MSMRTDTQLGSPFAARFDQSLSIQGQTFSVTRTRANSVSVVLVATIVLMPLAERAHAQGGIILKPRLTQTSDAVRAESLLRQVYEEGQQALGENRLADAERAFRRVLAMDPQNAGAYVNLGVIAMRRKQWAIALRNLE
jgi:Flp pilus assembly protein TadD